MKLLSQDLLFPDHWFRFLGNTKFGRDFKGNSVLHMCSYFTDLGRQTVLDHFDSYYSL